MTNAFERHGITHLSASQCNLFAAEPALWVTEKLLGKKSGVGAAAHRGSAVEHGVEFLLKHPQADIGEGVAAALQDYDRRMALNTDAKREKEREGIPGMVEIAATELRQYGPLDIPENGRQHKISIDLDGVPVPIIGYLDLRFGGVGVCVDLKTTLRMPSQISPPHARQGAIYHKALGNYELRFAYTTPKKIGVYRLENAVEALNEVHMIALTMYRFCSMSNDPHELAGLICPNYESFYWNSPTIRAAGREVFGW